MSREAITNLDTMMQGAVSEQFQDEFARLLRNVNDPNTEPTAVRSLTVTIKIKPDKSRVTAQFECSVKSTVAPRRAAETTVFIESDDNGNVIVTEKTDQIPGQISIDGEVTTAAVLRFDARKAD